MTLEQNITAILESYFSGFKDELIEACAQRIMEQIERQADTPQTERKCVDCRFLTYMYGKTWCNIKSDNPHDKVCDRFKPNDEQTERSE